MRVKRQQDTGEAPRMSGWTGVGKGKGVEKEDVKSVSRQEGKCHP